MSLSVPRLGLPAVGRVCPESLARSHVFALTLSTAEANVA